MTWAARFERPVRDGALRRRLAVMAPAEIVGQCWPGPPGGNWEGGAQDRQGRRWTHAPHEGWQLNDGPVFLRPRLTWRMRLLRWLPWR